MMKWGIVVALVYAGCGDDSATPPDSAVTPDAAVDAPAADASPYCQVPNNDANQGHKLLYLNYEGVVLVSCTGTTGCPDPTMDKSALIVPDGGTVPPFDSTITNRQAFLDNVTNKVRQAMAPYDVDVVTTRPASGPYSMIVFGGDCRLVTGMSCTGVVAYAPNECVNPWSPAIALVFDVMPADATFAANLALFNLGAMAGLSCSTQMGNCANWMGGIGNMDCTFTSNSTVSSQNACQGVSGTEDQLAKLKMVLGCR